MKKLLILLLFPLMMFSQDSTLIGDVDCSGEVNSQDASLILQFVTNVIDELPCEANMTGLTPDQLQEMIDMMEDQLSINYTAGSGGGCDYSWPDGLQGTAINVNFSEGSEYTVPANKRLYLTHFFSYEGVQVNGVNIINTGSSLGGMPVIINAGDVVSSVSDGTTYASGVLMQSSTQIEAININFSEGSEYAQNKRLYLTHFFSYEGVQVNGVNIITLVLPYRRNACYY